MEINVLISMGGILGAGLASWIGVRVALAQVQRDVANLEKAHEKHDKRLDRLEQRYFRVRSPDEE